jgi:hypothetical protein
MASDWSERTARSTRRSRPPANVSFELSVIDGPDAGKTFAIEASVVTLLGHSKVCAIHLEDDSVAPRHCSVEMTGSQLRLVDLGGGPRVNGVSTREAFLLGGEILRVGQTALVVRRKSAHETTSTALRAFGRVAGESPQMRALYIVFTTLAEKRIPLAIHGERGTGKRLLAEELHAQGPFRDGPFVVVPRRAPIAPFVPLAKGGTLYVEDGAPEQASELANVPADVRVIVGARGPFEAAGLVHVTLPPLREREGDVAMLARHFWTELGGEGGLPDDFIARVAEREWPGNCRELRIAVQDRLRHGAEETVSDIVEIASGSHATGAAEDVIADVVDRDLPFVPARHEVLAEFERRYVDHALEKAGHNVARAAANSGIAHRYFQVLKSRRKNA